MFEDEYSAAMNECNKLIDEYRPKKDPLYEGVLLLLDSILTAQTLAEAQARKKKVIQKLGIHLSAMWSRGDALGPVSAEPTDYQKADKLDSLAKMLEKQGKGDEAKKRREAAKQLRESKWRDAP